MRAVSITPKTKGLLRGLVSSGKAVGLWYFAFIRTERAFQEELLTLAERHQNEAFLNSLDEFLAQEHTKFIARQAAFQETERRNAKRNETKPKAQSTRPKHPKPAGVPRPPLKRVERSPNYNPTGQSFEQFLESRGIYINPNYRAKRIHFLQGGAPGLGKRA
jgi:hypothetical protein